MPCLRPADDRQPADGGPTHPDAAEPEPDLPPVDLCRGTRPRVAPRACVLQDAAKLRPLSNVSRSGANAATAPAVTGPIPGRVHGLRSGASVFDAAAGSSGYSTGTGGLRTRRGQTGQARHPEFPVMIEHATAASDRHRKGRRFVSVL